MNFCLLPSPLQQLGVGGRVWEETQQQLGKATQKEGLQRKGPQRTINYERLEADGGRG